MQQLKQGLEQHGLSDWFAILSHWLPQFDGWLAAITANDDPDAVTDDFPCNEIIDLLQSYSKVALVDDIHFAGEISRLGFLSRRARLTRSGKRWSSFEESYLEFAALEPDDIPHVFEFEYAAAGESVTKYWLLGKLYEQQYERLKTNRSPSTKKTITHS